MPPVKSIPFGSSSWLLKNTHPPGRKTPGTPAGQGCWGGDGGVGEGSARIVSHHFSRKLGLSPSRWCLHYCLGRWAGLGLQVEVWCLPISPSPKARVLPFPSFPQLVHMSAQWVRCRPNLARTSPPCQVIRCRQCSPFQLPADPASPATSSRRLPRPTGTRPGCLTQERMSSRASGLIRWDPRWFPHNFTCLTPYREKRDVKLRLSVLLSQAPFHQPGG